MHKVKNRETIEKDRLKQRNFGFIRHGSEIDNILETTKASPAFQNGIFAQCHAKGVPKVRVGFLFCY